MLFLLLQGRNRQTKGGKKEEIAEKEAKDEGNVISVVSQVV